MDAATALDLQVVYRIKVAFLFLLGYDTLLQLNEEYLYIWKSRWTMIKCLYLWTRYSAFAGAIIPLVHAMYVGLGTCDRVTTFTTIFSGFGIGLCEMILMIRTYTLYERSKRLLVFFFAMWSVLSGIAIWAVFGWTAKEFSTPSNSSGSTSCYDTNSSRIGIGLVCYFMLLLGESAIVLLTTWKVYQRFSRQKVTLFWKSMYCDGLWFYLAVLPFTIGTVVCLFAAPMGWSELFATPVQVMHSILCCRLVTHARVVAEQEAKREEAVNRMFKATSLLSNAVLDISSSHKV